ncbi:MAG TPA: hypothetical protein VNC50_10000 [Planctomycetia bacterium]|jgi:hypothetical protein|nr:hypothetical protein [Planctomycetia bacterium]
MAKKQANGAKYSTVVADRRAEEMRKDRRKGEDRRKRQVPVANDRRQNERRLGERRRQVDPTTCERDYTEEEISFMKAMDEYKRDFARPFPTWSEVLEVLKSLGYRKVAETTAIVQNRAKSTLNNSDA